MQRFKTNTALLLSRVVIGSIFIIHALLKLQYGVGGFARMLDNLNVPFANGFAWLITLAELIGGLALIVGAYTCLTSILLGLIMIAAIALVKIHVGLVAAPDSVIPGAELDLAILSSLLLVFVFGPGNWSLDVKYKTHQSTWCACVPKEQ